MADSPVVEFVKKEETWRLVEHAIVALSAAYGAKKLFGGKGFVANVSGFIVSAVKVMPGGQALIDKEQGAIIEVIKKEVTEAEKNMDNRFGDLTAIPEEGFSSDDILDVLKQWRSCEKGYRSGKQFGGIYTDDKELKSTISAAFTMFADSNGLYPTIFPALRKMEMEVVKMTANLLHGTPGKTCGVMTTGGTESIIMSILAHKKWAKATKGIVSPEAVVPVSAHAAFAKGCAYFDVKLVTVPLDENCRVDVNAVKKAINSNTIMLVGSAPTFPQGVIDPIEELAAIAKKNNIGMHVDSCLGGFLLPFLVKLGHLNKKFDFAVDGVTAMSADIHKFGYGPKQSSVILYASRELRKFQFFSYSDWTGGVYASPSLCGSRAGGTIAASWTTLVRLGNKGYLEKVSMCWNVMQQLVNGINAIDGLTVLGPPEASCVSFKSTGRLPKPNDVFKVADAMGERGWFFPRLQNPICCLVQVGAKSTFDAEQFLKDLESCVEEVVAEPLKYGEGMAKVYGMAATVPDRSVVDDLLKSYIDTIYS